MSTITSNINIETNIFVITNLKMNYTLCPGKKYKFDLSHSSNIGYQMSLSKEIYQYKDVKNIYFIGRPGYPGACVIYKPESLNSLKKVYIYNKKNPYRESFDFFPMSCKTLLINPAYNKNYKINYNTSPNVTCLQAITEMRTILLNGPKFFFEDSTVRSLGNIFKERYNSNKQYGLYKGTYAIINTDYSNPITVINKGKEHLIRIIGNPNKKTTIYLDGLHDNISNTSLDGSYNFYYDTIFIDISGDFGGCGLYCKKFGFNQMERLFIYSSSCKDSAGERLDIEEIESSLTLIEDDIKEYNKINSTSILNITDIINETIDEI